ncbi:tRNA guanine-N7-methyltransferase [Nitzschia inconspicua]|uniref:tRNA (guanine-N(7)-)-methyltransferase n=1 Tax=Nitzschia inconspicua TaxID=303405 RepID=A0A9K3PIX0_9STRA|nr:tRNA guanine-N7-methyltransferase [Nitzschia inconspicua]
MSPISNSKKRKERSSSVDEGGNGPSHESPSNHANDDNGDNNAATSITHEGEMPQKKFYRQRAHCNPLSHNDTFEYPLRPDQMDWSLEHYPNNSAPTVLDVGCGFGGLTVALATILPEERILGMEIRAKVTEYVRLRIVALRKEHLGQYQNASVMRTNSMKFLPNYFAKHSLQKIFFCFPDPHFKRKNHPRRIVSERLLSEYAYVLAPNAKLYTITDVKELHDWHVEHCDKHPLFERISESELADDPCVKAMQTETEESKKVDRNCGNKYYAVYRRIQQDPVTVQLWFAGNFFQKDDEKSE